MLLWYVFVLLRALKERSDLWNCSSLWKPYRQRIHWFPINIILKTRFLLHLMVWRGTRIYKQYISTYECFGCPVTGQDINVWKPWHTCGTSQHLSLIIKKKWLDSEPLTTKLQKTFMFVRLPFLALWKCEWYIHISVGEFLKGVQVSKVSSAHKSLVVMCNYFFTCCTIGICTVLWHFLICTM